MNKYKKKYSEDVAKTCFMFASNILGKGSAFFTNVILARFLSISDYGEFTYIYSIIFVISVISRFGFDQSLLNFIPKNKTKQNEKLNQELGTISLLFTFVMSGFIILIIWYYSDEISKNLLGNIKYKDQLMSQSGLVLCFGLIFVLPALFKLRKKIFAYSMQVNIGRFLLCLLCIHILFMFDIKGKWNPILSNYISLSLTIVVFLVISIRSKYFSNLHISNRSEYLEFLKFSFPLMLAGSIGLILNRVNIFMVGYLLDEKSVAIFNSASQISIFVSFVLVSINQVYVPKMSTLLHKNKIQKLNNLYSLINICTTIASLIILLCIILWGEWVLSWFGNQYLIAKNILIIISFGQIFNAISGPCGYIVLLSGKPQINLYLSLLTLFLAIVLNSLLIPIFGSLGAAYSSCFSQIFANSLMLIYMYQKIKIKPFKFYRILEKDA